MVLDIIFIITAVYGFYLGFSKGIIQTIFTVLSFAFGLLAAFRFSPAATRLLESLTGSDHPMMFIAGILLSFLFTMMVIRLLASGLESLLESANINIINQVAGGILLSSILILLYSSLLWFADQSRLVDSQTKQESYTYEYVKNFPKNAKDVALSLQPVFKNFWEHSLDFIDKIDEMSVQHTESAPNIYDIEEE